MPLATVGLYGKVLPNQKGCVEHKKRWRGVGW
jgi:hypothetical protein